MPPIIPRNNTVMEEVFRKGKLANELAKKLVSRHIPPETFALNLRLLLNHGMDKNLIFDQDGKLIYVNKGVRSL